MEERNTDSGNNEREYPASLLWLVRSGRSQSPPKAEYLTRRFCVMGQPKIVAEPIHYIESRLCGGMCIDVGNNERDYPTFLNRLVRWESHSIAQKSDKLNQTDAGKFQFIMC